MGMIDYLPAGKTPGGRVVAICSRDAKKLAGDWTSIQGNFGPRGCQMDLSGVSCYADFQAMLADPQVDLVDICVPNDAHGRMAIAALKAGKHGFELYFDRATLAFEFANLGGTGHTAMPLSVILPDGTVTHPELGSGDPIDSFAREIAVAVEAIGAGREAERLSGNLARQALKLCLAEIESVKTKKPIELA
jgi:predicted dehydrogenase